MALSPYFEPREARDREAGVDRDLGDRELVVLGVVLLEQGDLLVERADAALDDLRKRGLGLALAAGDLLDDATLVVDGRGGNVVLRDVLGVRERDVLRDAASRLGVIARVGENDTDLRRQVLRRAVQVDLELVAGEANQLAQLELLADASRPGPR